MQKNEILWSKPNGVRHQNTQIVLLTVFSCGQILFYHFCMCLRKCIFTDACCYSFLQRCRVLLFRKATVVWLSDPFYLLSLDWCPSTSHKLSAVDVLKIGTENKILLVLAFKFSSCNCYFSITISSYLAKYIDKAVCFRGQACYFRHSPFKSRCTCAGLFSEHCTVQYGLTQPWVGTNLELSVLCFNLQTNLKIQELV